MTLDRNQLAALRESVAIVRSQSMGRPEAAIILGSGLGEVAQEITSPIVIDYSSLPGFAKSTAAGHRGQLICGRLDGVDVVAMAGRFHRYEGYSDATVTFPVRLLAALGAERLIVSNAAGGLCPTLAVGDIVVIRDHIDMPRRSSFPIGAADRAVAGQAKELYDPKLMRAALQAARKADFHAQPGVYLSTTGPCYETRAEYRMMRIFGADVVGMSTVPEVSLAHRLGMRVLGLSIVSNVAQPDCPQPASHDEVLTAGRAAAHKVRAMLAAALQS